MLNIDLIFNLSLLIALSIISGFLDNFWDRNTRSGKLLQGILFGGIAVLGMLRPIVLEPGLIVDGRSLSMSLCALFFGPLAVAVAGSMAIICRLWLGGSGMITGVTVILIAAGIGLLARHRSNPDEKIPTVPDLYFFGLFVHLAMLATIFGLYQGDGIWIMKHIGLTVVLAYPLATILAGKILSDHLAARKNRGALEKNEQMLISAQRIAKMGHFTWDMDAGEVALSDALLYLLKYDRSDQIDDNVFRTRIHHPDDMEQIKEWLDFCISSGVRNLIPKEYQMVRKDGKVIYVRTVGVIEREKGASAKIAAIVQDITEQKRSEQALRESEKKYRKLFELESDAIFLIETETGRIVEANTSAADIYGYSREELSRLNYTDLSAGPSESAKAGIDCFTHIPVRYHRKKDGTVFPVEITASHLTWEGRQVHIDTVRDISFRIEAESKRSKLEKELFQARKMESIGMLAGGIAHDFNNILVPIFGFTELSLEEVESGSSIEQNLKEVLVASRRAKDLVKQILTFARQSEEEKRPIQPSVIAKEVFKFLRASLPAAIELQQAITSESLVMSSSTQLHQILMNLCTNAAYALGDKGGTLKLGIRDVVIGDGDGPKTMDLSPGNYIEMKISDTGVGIPPGIIDSIFDPYFTTKPIGDGTGMGLAMVHGIVSNCEGKITVESKVGEGSVFTIYLPAIERRAASGVDGSETVPAGEERILFVDDEATIVKLYGNLLEKLGYKVTTRTSSIEALELFKVRRDDFDIVITDLAMPNMNGDRLAAELMKIRPDIPVILCTGYSKKYSDDVVKRIGIKGFAYKPIAKNDFAKMIRTILDQHGK